MDLIQQLVRSPIGSKALSTVGLPTPAELRRHQPGAPVLHGPALLAGLGDTPVRSAAATVLDAIGTDVVEVVPAENGHAPEPYGAIVFDASGISEVNGLGELHDVFHRTVRHLAPSGRAIVLGRTPETCDDVHAATVQQGLEGFTRSLAKELRGGATGNLVYVDPHAHTGLESTLRFLLSGRSAYVNGQPIRVGPATAEEPTLPADWDRPLAGEVAVVTGAAQGIGEAIAETLARDGAHVVCLDLPAQGSSLTAVANRIGGTSLQLDITADDAPQRLAEHLRERHGGVDVVVHNAGITRDKTIVGMDDARWAQVLAVNLASQLRIDDTLLGAGVLNEHGRVVSVSSVSGIAGNRGQTNYATSKAGVIGRVRAAAPAFVEHRATINAVAPGFIETDMTDAMPVVVREAGRRMNSLNQGGLPVDVAETIAWLASPASAWVNGQVVRVCGQSLLGA